ncbi:MAG: lipid A export permease/ATP-binding protein MsbA [Gammaproteobacteria bacterium]
MDKQKITSAELYKRLLKYVAPYWKLFVVAILGSIVYSSVDAWFVHFIRPLLNKGFIQRDSAFISWLPAIVLGAFFLRGCASIASNYFMASVARKVVRDFRVNLFRYYQMMSAVEFDKTTTGQLLSAMVYNVAQIANASADALSTFLQSIVLIVGLLLVMFHISWKLSAIYFITIPFIVFIVAVSSRRMRRLSLGVQDSMGEITSITEENIDGYKVIRAFGGQGYELKRFQKISNINLVRELKIVMAKSLSMSGVQFVAAIGFSVLIYLSTSQHVGLTAGSFASIIAAMLALLKPMKDLTNVNNKIQKGLAGAQAVFDVLDGKYEEDDGVKALDRTQGHIQFSDVTFSYEKSDEPVLEKISFEVLPGKILALVGRSGSGKSTIVSLLMRFYRCGQGELKLDGESIYDYVLSDYRQQFAYVSQNVVLFNDTVANNIAYGSSMDNASREEIIAAAKAAHAMEFIESLPQGLDTMIGEDGVLLSGGQRQRLAIARAILKKAPILILDEATSSLDSESEKFIQEALDQLMHQCTTIVIAHRLSTIQQADNIIVMDRGSIIEQGKHAELLDKRGYYAKLHAMQFQD